MKEKEKNRIKELAEKSLKEKWYPLLKGEDYINVGDNCAFCDDVRERRKTRERKADELYCDICYIEILLPNFCYDINEKSTSETIMILEQLAEFGELKNESKKG